MNSAVLPQEQSGDGLAVNDLPGGQKSLNGPDESDTLLSVPACHRNGLLSEVEQSLEATTDLLALVVEGIESTKGRTSRDVADTGLTEELRPLGAVGSVGVVGEPTEILE